MSGEKQKLVGRHQRVAFMGTGGSTFSRMTGFTSLSDGKNAIEYTRQYVDEAAERSDVVGYSNLPGNLLGQICPQFTVLWFFLSAVAVYLDDWIRYLLWGEKRPKYKF